MHKYPVVILPGWMLGSDRFLPLKTAFEKAGYTTHIIDFPGFEQGEKLLKPWNLSDYVAYLEAFLKSEKISKAILVCHSFGGRVGIKLSSESPAKVAALILSGTPGYRSVNSNKLLTLSVIAKLGQGFFQLPPFSIFKDIARKLFHIVIGARDLSQVSGFMKQTFINIVEEELDDYMKKITLPTLLLWGAIDNLVAVTIAEKMGQVIKNAKLVVLPQLRHNFPYRHPDVFVKEAALFLKENKL